MRPATVRPSATSSVAVLPSASGGRSFFKVANNLISIFIVNYQRVGGTFLAVSTVGHFELRNLNFEFVLPAEQGPSESLVARSRAYHDTMRVGGPGLGLETQIPKPEVGRG